MENEARDRSVESPEFEEAMRVLKQTSRTFYIPITTLPDDLKKAVGMAYLAFRAIDEIEDHPSLPAQTKVGLLRAISHLFQTSLPEIQTTYPGLVAAYAGDLPEVTLRLDEWASMIPESIAPRVWDAVATMANRMADWAQVDWHIETEADLDAYTHSVAGAVGLLLSDLWSWNSGVVTNRESAVAYGRGLQAVNILRNTDEDAQRGVRFYPQGWTREDMMAYCRRQLNQADQYTVSLNGDPAASFCTIPLALARATLRALEEGREKLNRADVERVVSECFVA